MRVIMESEEHKLSEEAFNLLGKSIDSILSALNKTLDGKSEELGVNVNTLKLNILVGSIFGLAQGNVPKEKEEELINLISIALRKNFEYYHKCRNENCDED